MLHYKQTKSFNVINEFIHHTSFAFCLEDGEVGSTLHWESCTEYLFGMIDGKSSIQENDTIGVYINGFVLQDIHIIDRDIGVPESIGSCAQTSNLLLSQLIATGKTDVMEKEPGFTKYNVIYNNM